MIMLPLGAVPMIQYLDQKGIDWKDEEDVSPANKVLEKDGQVGLVFCHNKDIQTGVVQVSDKGPEMMVGPPHQRRMLVEAYEEKYQIVLEHFGLPLVHTIEEPNRLYPPEMVYVLPVEEAYALIEARQERMERDCSARLHEKRRLQQEAEELKDVRDDLEKQRHAEVLDKEEKYLREQESVADALASEIREMEIRDVKEAKMKREEKWRQERELAKIRKDVITKMMKEFEKVDVVETSPPPCSLWLRHKNELQREARQALNRYKDARAAMIAANEERRITHQKLIAFTRGFAGCGSK